MASPSEECRDEPPKETLHKTKVIQFLGRTTPVVLQNDNGPCPLLAICNVLLLRNNLNLSPDVAEVSQEKLLSLVAEHLIDSNSNVDDKDAGYVENQQQNIADAIDLLPRLTTGIDVNIKFRRIDDFEFTPECAIFDLLDIPLYHGWIVDPQDSDTASAIGLKSYNTIMSELVSLETQTPGSENNKHVVDDSIDFAAATAASLGVPSPCLSRGMSFDDSPPSNAEDQQQRKGDREEEEELMRILKLSEAEIQPSTNDVHAANVVEQHTSVDQNENAYLKKPEHVIVETLEANPAGEILESGLPELSMSKDSDVSSNDKSNLIYFDTIPSQDISSSLESDKERLNGRLHSEASEKYSSEDVGDETRANATSESGLLNSSAVDPSYSWDSPPKNLGKVQDKSILPDGIGELHGARNGGGVLDLSLLTVENVQSNLSNGAIQNLNVPEPFTSGADGSEPIYEGEECILESTSTAYENQEPMYEGEVVLAEQLDKGIGSAHETRPIEDMSPKQGELIRNFLKSSASQLTVYGLFCLQDGLKERELCVFFRNNHFNTMFKLDGELYLLAMDQGYLNQHELVWEKLNEVNGDTVFMTSNFKEFKVESDGTNSWDEQNAMASTVEYLATIDNSEQAHSSFNSDLQLAIALQQQEYEQQQQQQQKQQKQQKQQLQQRSFPQPTVSSGSRLVTGPQVSRASRKYSSSTSRPEPKSSKDKCVIM